METQSHEEVQEEVIHDAVVGEEGQTNGQNSSLTQEMQAMSVDLTTLKAVNRLTGLLLTALVCMPFMGFICRTYSAPR